MVKLVCICIYALHKDFVNYQGRFNNEIPWKVFIQEIATIIHHSSWSSGYDSWIKTPADPGSNPGGENKQLAAISLFNQILCLRIKDLDIFSKSLFKALMTWKKVWSLPALHN